MTREEYKSRKKELAKEIRAMNTQAEELRIATWEKNMEMSKLDMQYANELSPYKMGEQYFATFNGCMLVGFGDTFMGEITYVDMDKWGDEECIHCVISQLTKQGIPSKRGRSQSFYVHLDGRLISEYISLTKIEK